MIYLDSSAVVKLVHREAHTPQLIEWLNARRGMPLVASALVEIEVPRALRGYAPASLPAVSGTLARLYRLEMDAAVRASAATFPDPLLRSLDAIHLATALQLGQELRFFVAYDSRLVGLATRIGFTVASP